MDVFHLVDVPGRRRWLCSPLPSSDNLFRGWTLPGLCLLKPCLAKQYSTHEDGKPSVSHTTDFHRQIANGSA
jgi:hypothetical protein